MKINNEAVTVTVKGNEDPSCVSPCSGALEPMPLPGDNLGFDTTADEGLVTALQDRIRPSPTRLNINSQLETDVGVSQTKNGKRSGKEKGNYFLDPKKNLQTLIILKWKKIIHGKRRF